MNPDAMLKAAPQPQFLAPGDVLSQEQRGELLEYWRSIVQRKWMILALGVATALVVAAVVYAMPPVYRATATVLIEADKANVLAIDEVYNAVSPNREHYQTQIELLKSREVILRTVKGLKLWQHPWFDPRKAQENWRTRLKGVLGMAEPAVEWTEDALVQAAAARFIGALDVQPVRGSRLVEVSFESGDAALSAQVATAIAQNYIDNDREARFKVTQQASAWLQERVAGLREKLNASERALQSYRDKQGIVNLSGSVQAIDGQQIANLTERLVAARVRRAEMESVYNQLRQIKGDDYSSVNQVISHPTVADAHSREQAASQKVNELSKRYGYEHPKVVQANAELQGAQDSLKQQVTAVVASLTRDFEVARANERALEATLASSRSTVQSINRKEGDLSVLEREVEANRQLYELFMGRAKETSATNDLQAQVARIVSPAGTPAVPVRPKKEKTVLMALLAGLMAGALVSLLLDKLDNTIKGAEDAESRLRQPLLASFPQLSGADRARVGRMMLDSPESLYAEAVRTARTGVLLSNIDTSHKVLLVTSSVPGEGKTSVCISLGLAMAQTHRTLLIEADLRRPRMAGDMGLPANAKGLSNLVSGASSLQECLHQVQGSALHVIPAGDLPPNPIELLLSQRFRDMLAQLSQQYDTVLIDSPPVELVSDAIAIAPLATGTIYVVRSMETPYPLARKGLQRLQRVGAPVLGLLLNSVDFKKMQQRYGEYSAYGRYGYQGYGYKRAA